MAENKKSFLLYCDLISVFEELTDEESGKLIKHVLRYVNDLSPEAPDRLTKITFEPIKMALKRDLVKYETIREKKRLAGLASAEIRKQNQHMSTPVESVQHNPTHSTVIDSVSDSVSDSVIVKEKKERANKFAPPTLLDVENYFIDNGYTKESAKRAFNYYDCASWVDSKGNKVKSWKQKMQSVWFKEENKSLNTQSTKMVEYELMGAKYKKPEHIYLKDVTDFGDKVKLIKYV